MARRARLRVGWSPLWHLLSSLSTCKNLSWWCLRSGNRGVLHHWCHLSLRWSAWLSNIGCMNCRCCYILWLILLSSLWHSVGIEILMDMHHSLRILLLNLIQSLESFFGWHSKWNISHTSLFIKHDCHLVTQFVGDLAHIAVSSEWEVVIVATLTNPITRSFVCPLWLFKALLVLLIQLECWWFI